nr:hypothetical protein A7K92_09740 [Klebsiella pneumoniae]
MKPFTFWLAKRLVKTDYVSLPNLLAGRELVKERCNDRQRRRAAGLRDGSAGVYAGEMPMVVGYRMKPFTFWLAKRLVKTDYVSLPNLLAGRELVKELLQDECEPLALAAALQPLLADGKTSHEMHESSAPCISRSAATPMSRRRTPYWS